MQGYYYAGDYFVTVALFSQSLTVPDAVRNVIGNSRIYQQALELGIVNYTALAEQIKPQIEQLIGSKANTNTIVVAIKRLSDSLEKKQLDEKSRMIPNGAKAKLSLTGSILDLDLPNDKNEAVVDALSGILQDSTGFNFFQTDSHMTLLAEDAKEIRDILSSVLDKFEGTLNEGLSKITVALNPQEQDPYDMLSIVSGTLYAHQIHIRSAFFTGDEMVLVLSDKDAARAYDLIRTKIG